MTCTKSTPRKTNDSAIARLRIEHGLTQGQLAEMIGCYPKDISRWETGERNPSTKALLKISKALKCPVEYLIEAD